MLEKGLPRMDKIKKQIRNAGFAGLGLAMLTVLQSLLPFAGTSLASLIAMLSHSRNEALGHKSVLIMGLTPYWFYSILNLFLILGITFGVFKKNYICAVILFAYGVFALIASVPTTLALFGIPSLLLIVILVFLYKGMDGTFTYKGVKNQQKA